MMSLKSSGYVKEQFAWRHFYWYLTNEGIKYLRIFLHWPPTLKRSVRTETVKRGTVGRPDAQARSAEDRSAYRRAPTTPDAGGHDKKADVGPGSAGVEYREGFGRGRPAP
ncbi:jg8359 [Pararge aegeria aegeria]|uniref:Jg8359 protein n=1 Tax=Pararge aegeria aegeria TaxID=348720 RepID=A0A8S4SIW9_9NEOP|nr:jg8359 [Pararge aegeria aegeria]